MLLLRAKIFRANCQPKAFLRFRIYIGFRVGGTVFGLWGFGVEFLMM